jgi:hypothetical protein
MQPGAFDFGTFPVIDSHTVPTTKLWVRIFAGVAAEPASRLVAPYTFASSTEEIALMAWIVANCQEGECQEGEATEGDLCVQTEISLSSPGVVWCTVDNPMMRLLEFPVHGHP